MGYRKVYRTDDEATMNKVVKLLQRSRIPAYGKSEGAGEFLQISMGMSYQGRAIYVRRNTQKKPKNGLASGRKKESSRRRSARSLIP